MANNTRQQVKGRSGARTKRLEKVERERERQERVEKIVEQFAELSVVEAELGREVAKIEAQRAELIVKLRLDKMSVSDISRVLRIPEKDVRRLRMKAVPETGAAVHG